MPPQINDQSTQAQGAEAVNYNRDQAKKLGIDLPGSTYTGPTMSAFQNPANTQQTEADRFQQQLYKDANSPIDQGAIRQNYINQFQDQINALNQVYDNQLAQARQEGVGRVGSGTAILARRGLAGSPRGEAIKEGVLTQNRGIESAIQDERNVRVQSIYGQATQLAAQEAADKRAAKERGASAYLDYLKGQDTRRADNLTSTVGALISQEIDPSTMDAQELSNLAKTLGVDTQNILGSYKVAKAQADAQAAEAQFKKEGELLNRSKTQNEIDLANAKFAEDKRQFGLEYALKKQAADDTKAAKAINPAQAVVGISGAKDTISQIDGLINSNGLGSAVGPNALARLSPLEGFTNQSGNFVAGINQITSQLTLDKLVQAKSAGATFGALSDGERIVLAEAATKLNSFAKRNKEGQVIGYDATEAQVKAELNKIKRLAEQDLKNRENAIFSPDELNQIGDSSESFSPESFY